MTETRWQELLQLDAEIKEKQARVRYLAAAAAQAGEIRLKLMATETT